MSLYKKKKHPNLESVVKTFIQYLNYEEESDNGTPIHPVFVPCSRAGMSIPLDDLLKQMEEFVREDAQ